MAKIKTLKIQFNDEQEVTYERGLVVSVKSNTSHYAIEHVTPKGRHLVDRYPWASIVLATEEYETGEPDDAASADEGGKGLVG